MNESIWTEQSWKHSSWTTVLELVRFWFQRVFVPFVATIGLFGNLLTIVVMCQRRMSTSSTHLYLAALAFIDTLYLIFIFLLSLEHYPSIRKDLNYLKKIYWYCLPSLVFGCDFAANTSIWLTVSFTIER